MRTTVTLPDQLFHQAEAAARRLRVSRGELYAKALAEFLKRSDENAITERLNDIYSRHPAKVDSVLHRAQLKIAQDSSTVSTVITSGSTLA